MRRAGGDAIDEPGGVVLDEAEEGRAAGVLPRQADEGQAGHLGDAAVVDDAALGRRRRGRRSRSSPGGSRWPRRPSRGWTAAPSANWHRPSAAAPTPGPDGDAGPAQAAQRGADDQVAAGPHPAGEPRVGGLGDHARAGSATRTGRGPSTRCGSSSCSVPTASVTWWVAASSRAIWRPELPRADHDDRARRDVGRVAVRRAVQLDHVRRPGRRPGRGRPASGTGRWRPRPGGPAACPARCARRTARRAALSRRTAQSSRTGSSNRSA